ncbi:unnamed protein product, partial [Protopolystoma xenopodis]
MTASSASDHEWIKRWENSQFGDALDPIDPSILDDVTVCFSSASSELPEPPSPGSASLLTGTHASGTSDDAVTLDCNGKDPCLIGSLGGSDPTSDAFSTLSSASPSLSTESYSATSLQCAKNPVPQTPSTHRPRLSVCITLSPPELPRSEHVGACRALARRMTYSPPSMLASLDPTSRSLSGIPEPTSPHSNRDSHLHLPHLWQPPLKSVLTLRERDVEAIEHDLDNPNTSVDDEEVHNVDECMPSDSPNQALEKNSPVAP